MVGNPGIVSLRQFRDNEALIQLGKESPLINKKGLRTISQDEKPLRLGQQLYDKQ
jgi:hypothetical protein